MVFPRLNPELLRGIKKPEPQKTWVDEVEEPEIPQTPQPELKWYEQPKSMTENLMTGLGKGLAKIPGAPQALEFVSPALEFVHEKLEKPWSAVITSPFSPAISWKEGESWLEHEKREYEAWEAPTYVKGAAEFAMPLWWMPWLGWAGKGAKALGVGGKAISTVSKAGKLAIPTNEMLNASFKMTPLRKFSIWSADKPVLKNIVESVGGVSSFAKPDAVTPLEIIRRALAKRAILQDMRHGAKGVMLPRLQKFGDPIKLLDVDANGLVGAVKFKTKEAEALGRGLSEVIENPHLYTFANKEAKAFVMETRRILAEVRVLAEKEGVKLPKDLVFHRMVTGKNLTPEMAKKLGVDFEKSEYGSLFEMSRKFGTMEQGIKEGVVYNNNPITSVAATIDHYIRKIADKRFTDEVGKLGKTWQEKFAAQYPDIAEGIVTHLATRAGAEDASKIITKILQLKGTHIPERMQATIRAGIPKVADKLDDLLTIAPNDVDAILSAMGREALKAASIKPKDFKIMLAQFAEKGKIKLGDISDTIRQMNIETAVAEKAIEKIYRQAYKLNKQVFDDGLNALKKEADELIASSKTAIKPLIAQRSSFRKTYAGRQVLGQMEAKFRAHPVFRDKFFPKEVVLEAEKILGAKGQAWARGLAAASGTSRMLTASLDFSAPFIQGLALLGRNPVAWVKAVGQQFKFFAKPQNMYKYMVSPEARAIRTERVFYGGSASTFEFFETLAPIQRAVGKIPVIGKGAKSIIGQTYGRAEAAFTGFGEVARNELWKALRKPGMGDDQLRELARVVDRMTGVMSTEALGIGATQRDIESAFLFFAPRYTRASLAFVSDMFRGGMAGAEARKALGSLMASGVAFYTGVCTALGQEPEFNPRSSKFMTVKIGDDHIGIGGVLYGIMRLGAGVIGTATENPSDLISPFKAGVLNRFDNPFVKFMYQRTSPLTGMTIGMAVEQKDYFGEPFESPADWGRFMLDKITPIAFQRALDEDEQMTAPIFLSEVGGGRTFPAPAWELRDDMREKIAQERFGRSYESLPRLYQTQIDKEPEIEALQDEADVRTEIIGGLSYDFVRRRNEREQARDSYLNSLRKAQKAVDAGVITPYEFKEILQDEGVGLGKTYDHIDSNPEYAEVISKLNEPKDINKKFIGDIAYDMLSEARYSGKFEDEYGIFNYEGYEEYRDELARTYGEDVMEYVDERIAEGRKELPPLAQEYYKAQEVLKPYWDVIRDVEKIIGTPATQYQQRRFDSVVSKIRKRMKNSDPEMIYYYDLFYSR